MEIKQNPFSIYDFLGYLIPGAIFLYGILFIIGHIKLGYFSYEFVSKYLSLDKAEVYIPLMLAAYSVGHFINFLSSITIERYSIWALGYPSKYLLGLQHPGYFNVNEQQLLRLIIRTLVAIVITPISLSDFFWGYLAGMRFFYAQSLDKLLISVLRKKIDFLIQTHAGIENPSQIGMAKDHDFFRYAYHFALENAPNHTMKMQNYVALYGFLRTLSLISVIFFWGLLWHIIRGGFMVSNSFWVLLVFAIFLSYIFFMGFVKFYRRFSLEALMAMAVSLPEERKAN